MPRRPRSAHRVGETTCKSSQVAHEEKTSFSELINEGSREEDRPVVRKVLKRRREEDEEVDAEADIDVEADTPRFVQWLDDEDEPLPGRSWKDESTLKVPGLISAINNILMFLL